MNLIWDFANPAFEGKIGRNPKGEDGDFGSLFCGYVLILRLFWLILVRDDGGKDKG